jgi:GH24 family phage-related lysozyme (muramidase)
MFNCRHVRDGEKSTNRLTTIGKHTNLTVKIAICYGYRRTKPTHSTCPRVDQEFCDKQREKSTDNEYRKCNAKLTTQNCFGGNINSEVFRAANSTNYCLGRSAFKTTRCTSSKWVSIFKCGNFPGRVEKSGKRREG